MVPMSWGDLAEFINQQSIKTGGDFLNESVTVYDRSAGEYYPADTIEFEEYDDILDAGSIFIVIQA